MSRRRLARRVGRLVRRLLPSADEGWGWAVLHEIEAIEQDGAALAYALDALRGALLHRAAVHLTGGSTTMRNDDGLIGHPRPVGIICAVVATLLGLAYLAMAGAPALYLAVNAGSLVIGLLVLALVARGAQTRLPDLVALALGAMLLLTALAGEAVEGASRWLRLGPLFLQPSLILLPLMIVGFAQARTWLGAAALAVAALALALQPDRAMAGMLVAALAVVAVVAPDRRSVVALACAAVAFAVTLLRPDQLPAAAYVDQILYRAFDVHPLAGLAVLTGSALLAVPAVGAWRDPRSRAAGCAFGAAWLAAVAAAALGNYPTPLVGYGGSAILGYVLSLAMLPKAIVSSHAPDAAVRPAAAKPRIDLDLPTVRAG